MFSVQKKIINKKIKPRVPKKKIVEKLRNILIKTFQKVKIDKLK